MISNKIQLIISILTLSLCFSCYFAETEHTKNITTSPKTTQISCFERITNDIPARILTQSYKNDAGDIVGYDHKAQIQQLCNLEAQSKELYLIIGQGNDEHLHKPLDTDNNKRVWIYANSDPMYVKKDNTPHLLMNFDKDDELKTLPDNLFKAITFDGSTVKSFDNIPTTTGEQFKRILKPGAKLFIDALSHSGYGIIIDRTTFAAKCKQINNEIFTAFKGRRFCMRPYGGILYEIFAGAMDLSDSEEQLINEQQEVLNKDALENIFGKEKCILKEAGYPVLENNNSYFECIK